jgi:hypothetical protein
MRQRLSHAIVRAMGPAHHLHRITQHARAIGGCAGGANAVLRQDIGDADEARAGASHALPEIPVFARPQGSVESAQFVHR